MYLTIKDVANMMKVSEETVRRWIRDGKLAAEDMGGRLGYRILQEDFEKFSNLRNATSAGSCIAGASVATQVGAGMGAIFGGPVGLAVGGVLGGIVGKTFMTLTTGNKDEQKKILDENRLKLEARKYEIEQTKIELDAKIKLLDSELLAIERLLEKK